MEYGCHDLDGHVTVTLVTLHGTEYGDHLILKDESEKSELSHTQAATGPPCHLICLESIVWSVKMYSKKNFISKGKDDLVVFVMPVNSWRPSDTYMSQ